MTLAAPEKFTSQNLTFCNLIRVQYGGLSVFTITCTDHLTQAADKNFASLGMTFGQIFTVERVPVATIPSGNHVTSAADQKITSQTLSIISPGGGLPEAAIAHIYHVTSYLSKKDFCFHTHVCIFPAIFL